MSEEEYAQKALADLPGCIVTDTLKVEIVDADVLAVGLKDWVIKHVAPVVDT